MNNLKRILRNPLDIGEFMVYIDPKTVYNIYFESKILDTTTNKFYKSSDGCIKGNFDIWFCCGDDSKSFDSEICIYFEEPIF